MFPQSVAANKPVGIKIMIGCTKSAISASFTSRAPIFLPRYSGVRPTMSPPMNTVMMANSKIVYRPLPTPPGVKETVSLRLDRDVLDFFQADGPGWQDRINAALRKAAGK